jgi:hypothetical protein
MAPVIITPHRSRRAVTLPMKAMEAPCQMVVVARALMAYSRRTSDVPDTADDLLGVAVSVSVHYATADNQVVCRLVVVWADDEFAQRMLRIVAPNLLMANASMRPITPSSGCASICASSKLDTSRPTPGRWASSG